MKLEEPREPTPKGVDDKLLAYSPTLRQNIGIPRPYYGIQEGQYSMSGRDLSRNEVSKGSNLDQTMLDAC